MCLPLLYDGLLFSRWDKDGKRTVYNLTQLKENNRLLRVANRDLARMSGHRVASVVSKSNNTGFEEEVKRNQQSIRASAELVQAIKSGETERAQAIEASDATLQYSFREEDPPKKTVIAYKAFYARDGKLYTKSFAVA